MPFILSTARVKPGKTEQLRAWYKELEDRRDEALETQQAEGVRQEHAFILPGPDFDLLAVFVQVDDMEKANASFFSSPFKIDAEHLAVMDECTEGGGEGRIYADLLFSSAGPLAEVGRPRVVPCPRGARNDALASALSSSGLDVLGPWRVEVPGAEVGELVF